MFLPMGELDFYENSPEAIMAREKIHNLNLEDAESHVKADKDMILSVIQDSPGGMPRVTWQIKRTLSQSAMLFLASLVLDTSCFMFAWTWIYHLSSEWLRRVSNSVAGAQTNLGKMLPCLVGITFVIISGVWHLRGWRRLARCANIRITINALIDTLRMGSRYQMMFGCCCVCELILVLAMTIEWVLYNAEVSLLDYVTCSEPTLFLCIEATMYAFLKTVPWFAVWIFSILASQSSQAELNIHEFQAVAPRIGFMATVLVSCGLQLLKYLRPLNPHDLQACLNVRMANFSETEKFLRGDMRLILHCLLISLSTWGFGVTGDLISKAFSVWRNGGSSRKSWQFFLVLFICIFVGFLVIILPFHLEWEAVTSESWVHLFLGFSIWALAALFWNRWYCVYLLNLVCGRFRNHTARSPELLASKENQSYGANTATESSMIPMSSLLLPQPSVAR